MNLVHLCPRSWFLERSQTKRHTREMPFLEPVSSSPAGQTQNSPLTCRTRFCLLDLSNWLHVFEPNRDFVLSVACAGYPPARAVHWSTEPRSAPQRWLPRPQTGDSAKPKLMRLVGRSQKTKATEGLCQASHWKTHFGGFHSTQFLWSFCVSLAHPWKLRVERCLPHGRIYPLLPNLSEQLSTIPRGTEKQGISWLQTRTFWGKSAFQSKSKA